MSVCVKIVIKIEIEKKIKKIVIYIFCPYRTALILISNDFWHNSKIYNFEPYNLLLSISTNIAVLLMTDFVLQGHIYHALNALHITRV